MLTQMKVRGFVLAAHGVLALCLGLALFYLRAAMTNLFFEAIATVIALFLSAAALLMAAVTDWVAAFTSRLKHLHQSVFYVLAGALFTAIGFYVGWYPKVSMQLLLILAAAHAAAAGIWSVFFVLERRHGQASKVALSVFGMGSFLFTATFVLLRHADNPEAIGLLCAYTSFIGVKMLFFAWRLWRLSALLHGRGAKEMLGATGHP